MLKQPEGVLMRLPGHDRPVLVGGILEPAEIEKKRNEAEHFFRAEFPDVPPLIMEKVIKAIQTRSKEAEFRQFSDAAARRRFIETFISYSAAEQPKQLVSVRDAQPLPISTSLEPLTPPIRSEKEGGSTAQAASFNNVVPPDASFIHDVKKRDIESTALVETTERKKRLKKIADEINSVDVLERARLLELLLSALNELGSFADVLPTNGNRSSPFSYREKLKRLFQGILEPDPNKTDPDTGNIGFKNNAEIAQSLQYPPIYRGQGVRVAYVQILHRIYEQQPEFLEYKIFPEQISLIRRKAGIGPRANSYESPLTVKHRRRKEAYDQIAAMFAGFKKERTRFRSKLEPTVEEKDRMAAIEFYSHPDLTKGEFTRRYGFPSDGHKMARIKEQLENDYKIFIPNRKHIRAYLFERS